MKQVAVDGQLYAYEEVGNGKKTPVLVLHGWGRSKEEWLGVAGELASERVVYTLDLPGFGGSPLPQGVSNLHDYAKLVVKFCKYLKIGKIVLIGHSLGGRVGILLAQPNSGLKVEQLILIDPAGVKSLSIRRLLIVAISKIFGFLPQSLRRSLGKSLMDEDYRSSPALQTLYRVVVGRDLRGYLAKIKSKVVVVWGEDDQILPLSLTRVYRRILKNYQIRVVWGADHDPHLTKYDQLVEILREELS